MADVWVKSIVAQSTFDYVKHEHGLGAWQSVIDRLPEPDRVAVTSGGNVSLASMGAFNTAFVDVVCAGSKSRAESEFRQMGKVSAEKLLQGNGIFAIFARFVAPKQVLARADSVIKSAYPGAAVEVTLNPDESGGTILIHGMSGYPYGSQRIVGWLTRGIEIVGGHNARVAEKNWDAGRVDSDTYEITLSWEGWR